MSTTTAGKRNWKCPECGREIQLSVAQLDPIACEDCLKKMKGEGGSTGTPSVTSIAAGPLGIWSSLPETTKLVIAVAALAVGFIVGYQFGQQAASPAATNHRSSSHSSESAPAKEHVPSDDNSEPETETRPDPPGPGYKWVRGRKHKDGTMGKGYWAKDPRAAESKGSE